MPRIVKFPAQNLEQAADPNRQRVADAIKLLLDTLSSNERERVLRDLFAETSPISTERPGPVLGELVRLLPRRAEWTVEELKQEIAARGIGATPKAIYNSLAYLTRKRRIRRIGYGRYLVDGGLLVTADDLGGEPARDEDE